MAERRQIGLLAQTGPIGQVSQRAVLTICTHGVNPSGQPSKVEQSESKKDASQKASRCKVSFYL